MRQPVKIIFDPPIRINPPGGSAKFQIKDDGTLDWVLIVQCYA